MILRTPFTSLRESGMRFALLGNHPDGVEMACALVECGRHRLVACTALLDEDSLRRLGDGVRKVSDVEEVLADPAVEMVLVAGDVSVRAAQLRRALQSERPVLCVHPADQTPDAAYEAAMIQADTAGLLLPLLPEATHPGLHRLAQLLAAPSPLGPLRLLEFVRSSPGELLDGVEVPGRKPSIPGWDILRLVGGDIAEVSAFSAAEELLPGQPLLVAGRFERGGLFQMTLLPAQPQASWRITAHGVDQDAELYWPQGWLGPAYLSWREADSEMQEEAWEPWDPWPTLVEQLEVALAARPPAAQEPSSSWQGERRALELDAAARRSVERRRSSPLEYPEASEEVGFKGTMTLAGCGMVWLVLVLVIASIWLPAEYRGFFRPLLGWLIGLMLVFFLGGQLLRYLIPVRAEKKGEDEEMER
jgi:predicted dehydrogenase